MDLRIDKYKLEEECEKNVTFTKIINDEVAKYRSKVDKWEREVKKLNNEKDLYYRMNPLEDVKVTEPSIKSMVGSDVEVIEAESKLVEAKKQLHEAESLLWAVNDRQAQLKNLVSLWIGGYYSKPDYKHTN
jgi:hypothetical protein